MNCRAALWAVVLVATVGLVQAAGTVAGRYAGVEDPSMSLTVEESADGRVTGRLADGDAALVLEGRRTGDAFTGTLSQGADVLPVTARLQGDRLLLEVGPAGDGELVSFVRSGGAPAAGKPAKAGVPATAAVLVNGTRLSATDLARVEKAYSIRVPPGEFWYDRVLGAWGGKGGPTMGFITPGLALGGPLQADASGGGTNVFVNGRALHPYDLLALERITGPIVPGRYFITADGLAGPEGGPPLWNLAALAAQSQAQGGGSNTWQSRVTGGSGFSDGTTGAVFLPNGGIVSTGN